MGYVFSYFAPHEVACHEPAPWWRLWDRHGRVRFTTHQQRCSVQLSDYEGRLLLRLMQEPDTRRLFAKLLPEGAHGWQLESFPTAAPFVQASHVAR